MFYVLLRINDFIFTAHVQKRGPDSLKCPEKCKRYSISPLNLWPKGLKVRL